jgi:hypothetical protein
MKTLIRHGSYHDGRNRTPPIVYCSANKQIPVFPTGMYGKFVDSELTVISAMHEVFHINGREAHCADKMRVYI